MGNPADLFPPASTPRHGVQGTVTRAPDDALDTISVAWDADGDDGAGEEAVVEVGVPWASNGRLPAVDDVAILFNDDRGDPHAIVFATGAAITPDATAAVAALDTRLDALEAGPSSPTAVSSFANSWVNFDTDRPAAYYKHAGRVYLSGQIKSGSVNSAAFTLPVGYRPDATGNVFFPVESNGAYGSVYVSPGGAVTPASPSSNVYVSLYGISFRAA